MPVKPSTLRNCISFGLALGALALASPSAADGRIEINHTRALIGGITPGDKPGYPVSITEPGSYRLTSDLLMDSQTDAAIEVEGDHVTLDLGGFAIRCVARSCEGSGVRRTSAGVDNTVVRNGSILGMAAPPAASSSNAAIEIVSGAVEDLFVDGGASAINVDHGLVLDSAAHNVGPTSSNGVVEGSLVLRTVASDSQAGAFGAMFLGYGVFAENSATSHTGDAFKGSGVFHTNTSTFGTGGGGTDGFQVNFSAVIGNTISEYDGDGVVGRGNLILGNTIRGNTEFGIRCFNDVTSGFRENVVSNSGTNLSAACVNLFGNACDGGFCP